MKSGTLCALLWRILTWYSRKQVTSPTHSRWLNIIAGKLSSLSQTRQSSQNGPSCQSFSKQYASGGTSPKWACFCHLAQQQTVSTCITGAKPPNMDNGTISLPWEDLNPYAFPLVAILGKWWRSCRITHAGESLRLLQSGPTCLFLGSLDHVKSDSLVPVQPALSTIQ